MLFCRLDITPIIVRGFSEEDSGVIVDVERLLEGEELARLVEVAEERGRVRASQLNELLEPMQLDALESESIYRELEKRAIEVIDDRVDDDAPRAGSRPDRRSSRRPTRCSSSCARRPGTRC